MQGIRLAHIMWQSAQSLFGGWGGSHHGQWHINTLQQPKWEYAEMKGCPLPRPHHFSPATLGAKGDKRNAEDEEDGEGDDAHLGWREPAQHIDRP